MAVTLDNQFDELNNSLRKMVKLLDEINENQSKTAAALEDCRDTLKTLTDESEDE